MATFGYARVSSAEQVKGMSLDDQQRTVEAVAMMRDEQDQLHIIVEAGISGAVPLEERPAGRIMIDALKPGDVIIVAKLDRAFRSAEDALRKSREWGEQGISLIVADMGTTPVTDNGASKMFFGMLALVAEFEKERLAERTRDGRAAKKLAGGHIGGTAPFGYRVVGKGKEAKLLPIATEQVAIGRILTLREDHSLRSVSRMIREELHIKISHEGVRKVIAEVSENPAYYQPPGRAK